MDCDDCDDKKGLESHIDDLLNIFQQIYNNAKLGLNSIKDNETVLKHIINLVKDYVKEE
jgi:hypothetical protein